MILGLPHFKKPPCSWYHFDLGPSCPIIPASQSLAEVVQPRQALRYDRAQGLTSVHRFTTAFFSFFSTRCFPYVSRFSQIFPHVSRSTITWECDRWRCCVLPLVVSLPLEKTRWWHCQEKNHGIWSINQVLEKPNTLPAIAKIHGTKTMLQQRLNANVFFKKITTNPCVPTKLFNVLEPGCSNKWSVVFQLHVTCSNNFDHCVEEMRCDFWDPNMFGLADETWSGHHHPKFGILHSSGIWVILVTMFWGFFPKNCIQMDFFT